MLLLLRTERPPEGPNWLYELKFDGYRAIAAKASGRVHVWSRNEKGLRSKLSEHREGSGESSRQHGRRCEIVALDEAGEPSFKALQNHGSSQAPLVYYVFDVVVLAGRDLSSETLDRRKQLLAENPDLSERSHSAVAGVAGHS
jgi:bifunctional non-homologous end joining protein LigD